MYKYNDLEYHNLNSMKLFFASITIFLLCSPAIAQTNPQEKFWELNKNNGITWHFDGKAHKDHIEMSGKRVSVVLRYGVNQKGNFECNKGMIWPMLRTIPNNTHASLQKHLEWDPLEVVKVNKKNLQISSEKVKNITLDGMLTVESHINKIFVRRILFPSTDLPALIEVYQLKNTSDAPICIEIGDTHHAMTTPEDTGVYGAYLIEQKIKGQGVYQVASNDSITYSSILLGRKTNEILPQTNGKTEMDKRKALVRLWLNNLILETPNEEINRMFAFSKIRSLESIFETKSGPMHSPGGEAYYAAVWTNDQAEYANPFFPFTGYQYAMESAMLCYNLFAGYMNKDWKALPSSVISEGIDCFSAAGDRGEAAMVAYGAARYALASGNMKEAKELWPLITWCLEYCRRYLNKEGVVTSDSDELEGRFPCGEANLCTSSLYYDALISSSYLAKEIGEKASISKSYKRQADSLKACIDTYFHTEMYGFDTYRYYKGNTLLRAWICIPLTMGIYDRAQGTIEALFSSRLWTENGLLTQENDKTFWDRSTLYALRSAFMAGATKRALDFFSYYSHTRLLCNHVPYAIEAWPEGGQRHLSAESALYARIITEGLFGIRPTGLNTFTVSPRLPEEWPEMTLRHIRICNSDFDIRVLRNERQEILVQLWANGKMRCQKKGIDNLSFKIKSCD